MVSSGRNNEAGMVAWSLRQLLERQIEYYSMRADAYDDAFGRRGRFDHGEKENRAWLRELKEVENRLISLAPLGRVLELACGTGLWTERLMPLASAVHAIDASARMLELCSRRIQSRKLSLEQADLFRWEPEDQYDFVFFGFWLSHVPRVLADDNWRKVIKCLGPGGRLMFIDHIADRNTFAVDEEFHSGSDVAFRRCADDSHWMIVKVFYSEKEIREQLSAYSWRSLEISSTGRFFIYGIGELTAADGRPETV
jgi:SAM-dependent methyltransferase